MTLARRPATYDIVVVRGDDWSRRFVPTSAGVPTDLTGWTARAQARKFKKAPDPAHDLRVSVGANGITVAITPDDYVTLVSGYWDLETTDAAGLVQTLIEGAVVVKDDVTR